MIYQTKGEKNDDHKILKFIDLREEIRILRIYLAERVSEKFFRNYILCRIKIRPYSNTLFMQCFNVNFHNDKDIYELYLVYDPKTDEIRIQDQNTNVMEFMLIDRDEHIWRRVFKMWKRLETLKQE